MEVVSAAGDAPNSSPPPLISLALLRRETGNDEIFDLDVNELSRRVRAGVLLKYNKEQGEAKNGEDQGKAKVGEDQGLSYTHKYWVHEKLNKNCWMVLAKVLTITWGPESHYWTWTEEKESCYHREENKVPIAELKRVCWLEITGKCTTIMLSPSTTYEVAVFVKMRSRSNGWEVPVNLSLTLPDGNKQGRMERLDRLEKEKWLKISIGKFVTTPQTVGEISFSLTQTDGRWKSGLCVKGVVFESTTG
ncbi:hypothetical protein BT93_J1847 [Corymbia citriodora subsp. variegata]|nr:hypothetical protein BT93_J1847 [Corymbia citriodora subsp. variegata]